MISIEIFPSSVIFGFTSNFNTASLKVTVGGELPDAELRMGLHPLA